MLVRFDAIIDFTDDYQPIISPIWLNPDHIVSITPAAHPDNCLVSMVNNVAWTLITHPQTTASDINACN